MKTSTEVRQLIITRAKEYGYVIALLELSNAGVNVLRLAEGVLRMPQQTKKSVRMEYVREALNEQKRAIEKELESLVELLVKALENE